jgi:hypothetical protein
MVRRPTEVPLVQAHHERNHSRAVRPRLHGQIYCSCNICIHHIPVVYAGGRAPTVGALGDAWSSCRELVEGLFIYSIRQGISDYTKESFPKPITLWLDIQPLAHYDDLNALVFM